MNMYVHAAQYDVQIALQGTIKHQILTMERNILGDIQDAISPIITQTCLGDPTEDPESIYLPPAPHHSAIYTYVRNLCRPLQDQHDKDTRAFLHDIVDLTHTHSSTHANYT